MGIEDNGPVDTDTRVIIELFSPAARDRMQQFITEHHYPFYAILLGRDSDTELKTYVEQNWTNLHYMGGDECLLISAYGPKDGAEEVRAYWKETLGESFEAIYTGSPSSSPTSAWSYQYVRELGIPNDKLPCLFIGTDLTTTRGFAVTIPPWGAKDLQSLFEMVFQKTHEAAGLEPEERLEAIVGGIKEFYRLRKTHIYVKNHWMEYVNGKEILKKIIETLIAAGISALKAAI
jgi:hypothetical protein